MGLDMTHGVAKNAIIVMGPDTNGVQCASELDMTCVSIVEELEGLFAENVVVMVLSSVKNVEE